MLLYVCVYNSTKEQIQTLYSEDKAHLATTYLGMHVKETVHILSV